jgi:hypothetical protein
MKRWLSTVFARLFGSKSIPATHIAENGTRNSQDESERFVDMLIELGYFKFVADSDKAMVRTRMIDAVAQRRLNIELDDSEAAPDRRLYYTDAEGLSEGIARQISLMKDVLRQEGCHLDIVEDVGDQEHREFVINRKRYLLYEWPNLEPPDLDTWGLGHKRLVEIVSDLLHEAGSQERLFGIAGFNDAKVILLTSDMFGFIRSRADLLDDHWMPHSGEEMKLTHEC